MKRILVDANVVLDVVLDRQPHAERSAAIWKALETGTSEGLLAAPAITTLHYLIQKELRTSKARRLISEVLRVFRVAAVDAVIEEALRLSLADFEDAVTAAAARSADRLSVLLRQKRHYPFLTWIERYNTAMQRLLLFGFLGIIALKSAHGAGCDRACLKTMLDQYVNAVVQHNPAAAPLSVGYRETENGMVRRPGTGLWQSAKALGKLQRRYLDPESGQAGYFGTLEDEGGTAVVTVRLKIEDRKITEAEWFLARKGDPGIGTGAGAQANAAFHDSDYLIAHPPAERVVPKAERLSRADMVAITNSYFDGLSAHDGTLIIAHPGCVRLENGVLTTQRAIPSGGTSDCTSNGAMANIFAVTARRYPIVDEEAGVVLSIGLFERKPGVAMRRNLFSEWFVIEQGKIRSIYSAMLYPDQEAMVPNWPPFDGNWPVAPPPK